jgi:hypothetical protein
MIRPAAREFRVGPETDPDYYVVGATPVASGSEGILYRGSLTAGNAELEVAVKMLQPCYLHRVDEWFPRWCEQVELLRSLHFPGVVGVRDGFMGPLPHPPGEAAQDRTLYLVMNWVDGEPLDEWVARRPERDVFGTLKQLLGVAAALDFMHSGRATGHTAVVHGDVKPSNILVTDEGTVLVDFGLCRGLPGGESSAAVSGTRGYIAPEILADGLHTPAADRYAFGAVAYFVLTGREVPRAHRPGELRAALAALPALAGREDTVDQVMAILDADPGARPTSLTNWLGQVRRSTLPPLLVGVPGTSLPTVAPAPTVEALREAVSRLAHRLYTVDIDADSEFLRVQSNRPGRSGELASGVTSALDRIWVHYSMAADVVDRLETAVAEGRTSEAQRLLDTHAVEICPGTSMSVAGLVDTLERQLNDVVAGRDRLVAAARQAVTAVDDATKLLDHLAGRAAAITVDDEPTLAAARAALDATRAAVAEDPLSPSAGPDLAGLMAVAGRRIDDLEAEWERLPGRLAQARGDLATIVDLVAQGADALADAQAKVTNPTGLLEPLAASVVEGEPRALGPWLERIERYAEHEDWRSAVVGLDGWQRIAAAHLVKARQVLAANRSPVIRRNDLRGLLHAFRAKAAREDRAEDPVLMPLYQAACDSLYEAPCDLERAATRVQAFVDAVNAGPRDAT